MSTSRTLPSGQVIENVPSSVTDTQFKEYALLQGLATEADYNMDRETKADYLSTVTEIGGGVAGAMYGASIGTAMFPGVGTAIGGIIGGGLGAAAGYFSGEVAESYVEDRDFNVEQATDESIKAGLTDAAFGAGFGVVAKGLKTIYKPVRELFQPNFFGSAGEESAASVALAVKRGETTLEEVAASGKYPPEYMETIVQNIAKRGEELETAVELNKKLAREGTQLLPTQAVSEYTTGNLAQDYASSSIFMGRMYDDILQKQDDYIKKQFSEILGKTTDDKTREETGMAIANLVKDSDTALTKVVTPLYQAIDKKGSLALKTGNVKNGARRTFNAKGTGTTAQKTVLNYIENINTALSPKEVYKELRKLRELSSSVSNDGVARAMLNGAMKNLNNTMKTNKGFVRPTEAIKRGTNALDELITQQGTTGISGAHKKIAEKLKNMRENMSFSEAHVELSTLKAMQRDAARSVGEKSSKAEKLINEAITDLTKAMDRTADVFSPALKRDYDTVRNLYKEGIDTIHGKWITKALKKDNVADIGQYLVKAGEELAVKDVKALLAKARELKVDTQGNNLLESIEKEFINNLFPTGSAQSGKQFMEKMSQGKFADTFNAIVGKEKGEKLVQLGKEIELMEKGVKGSESALSLSVKSGEIAAARSPTFLSSILYPVFGYLAKNQLSAKVITKKLNSVRAVNKSLQEGKPVPKAALDSLMDGLPKYAIAGGAGLSGAAINQNQQ